MCSICSCGGVIRRIRCDYDVTQSQVSTTNREPLEYDGFPREKRMGDDATLYPLKSHVIHGVKHTSNTSIEGCECLF
jgi:hypothetical protein